MRLFKYLGLAAAAIVLTTSCSNEDIPRPDRADLSDGGNPGSETAAYQNVSVQITGPAASLPNIRSTSLFSMGVAAPTDGAAGGTLPFNPGTVETAFLLDENDEVLLAGFLTDDRKEISVATTVEVLLYFNMLNPLRSDGYKKIFIENIQINPVFREFVTQLEGRFLENPQLFSTDNFIAELNGVIEQLSGRPEIDLAVKINFGSIAQSGLNLNETGEQSFSVTNSYPRRAHAFVYKVSYKDEAGNETILNSEIEGNDTPDRDFALPYLRLLDESEGNFQNQVTNFNLCSQGARYEAVTSDELNLELFEGRSSETYELAIIGPGRGNLLDRPMTKLEREKFEELSTETFIMDYFLPILMDIGGNRDVYSAKSLQDASSIIPVIEPILKAHAPSFEAVLENDFETAIQEFFPFLYGDIRLSNDFRNILSALYELIDDGSSPNRFIQNQELIQEGELRYTKITAFITRSLKESVGIHCINERLGTSSPLENWELKISQGKVKLKPEMVNTVPFDDAREIRAVVFYDLEEGETLEYEWSTTSQYGGILNDYNGQDGTSFTSTSERVGFFSNASSTILGDGDNLETVSVKVYVVEGNRRDEIGQASMNANVKKKRFEIKPDGITIAGNDRLKMKLVHTNGVTKIPNDEFEYKVEWRSQGNHGLIYGIGTSFTAGNVDYAEYWADDLEVEQGEEKIEALIYARRKGTNDAFALIDEPEATVNIQNDELVVFDYVNISVRSWGPEVTGDYTSAGVSTVWAYTPWAENDPRIPEGYEVESYAIRIIERIPDLIPSCTRTSGRWTAAQALEQMDEQGTIYVTCGFSGVSSPTWLWDGSQLASIIANANAARGYAQVTIRLKPRGSN